ncbi:penicillin-insensitive murein endopeptidase [Alginatibacterium sediminis]|uniref:Penicillin-insensitive murein endopeptidase n=2 Tax=Alginatibacterium sediminis TaxID=2164068 RepID=A0A420ELE6_9ALTE|nr:penicillin-insensitive murein endopeptidase [Alginatibacterium sediminis]
MYRELTKFIYRAFKSLHAENKLHLLGFILFISHGANANPWEAFKSPLDKPADAIGSYSNGCLAGAKPLPIDGEGYMVMRTSRNRYYGHPSLVDFVQDYAKLTHQAGLPYLLVGDMSMPRGGNFSSGHASHQIGLDADIWFKRQQKMLSIKQRENISAVSMVDLANYRVHPKNWSDKHAQMVQLAASDERVARIFVSPIIKQELCAMEWSDDAWLGKVRPWWGHTYHMHVRLNCPEGDTSCVDQAPPPPGNGCNDMQWWKTTYAQIEREKKDPSLKKPSPPKAKKKPKIKPSQCELVLSS